MPESPLRSATLLVFGFQLERSFSYRYLPDIERRCYHFPSDSCGASEVRELGTRYFCVGPDVIHIPPLFAESRRVREGWIEGFARIGFIQERLYSAIARQIVHVFALPSA